MQKTTLSLIFSFLLFIAPVHSDEISNTYDGLGRLKSISYQDGYTITQVAYDYDAAGNITNKDVTVQIQDSDGDGLPDAWETLYGLDPDDPDDAGLDSDGDGLTNVEEYENGTDPTLADTDGDGVSDGDEVAAGTDPLDAESYIRTVPAVGFWGLVIAFLFLSLFGRVESVACDEKKRWPKNFFGSNSFILHRLSIYLLLALIFSFLIHGLAHAETCDWCTTLTWCDDACSRSPNTCGICTYYGTYDSETTAIEAMGGNTTGYVEQNRSFQGYTGLSTYHLYDGEIYIVYGFLNGSCTCEESISGDDSDGDGIPDDQDYDQIETDDKDLGQDQNDQKINCSQNFIADPINIFNGNLFLSDTDLSFGSAFNGNLDFQRFYNSQNDSSSTLGAGWTHNFDFVLYPSFNDTSLLIKISDASGRGYYFEDYDIDDVYTSSLSDSGSISQDSAGDYVWEKNNGDILNFDSSTGNLLSITDLGGNIQTLTYNDTTGLLETVTDQASGKTLTFSYNSDNRISSITGPVTTAVPDGIWVSYEYDDNNNLTKVTYADDGNGSTASGFEYRYEDSNDVNNLTAKYDLEGHLLSSWAYDENDRAVSNTNIQGTGVDSIDYTDTAAVVVTDAYGIEQTYQIEEIAGRKKIIEKSNSQSCSTCSDGIKTTDFDSDTGYPTQREYFNGRIDLFQDYDDNGNAGTHVISSGSSEERTLAKTWHPVMPVPLTITEKSVYADDDNTDRNKVIIFDYDDPADEDDSASVTNENPTNLIYQIIEKGYTLDETGAMQEYVHTTVLTYNTKGQIESIDGPRDGSEDSFTYTYDDTTGHLTAITSPVTGSVLFTDYDDAGAPGTVTDANGVATQLSYDGRNRLLTAVTEGKTYSMTYTAAGLVQSLTDRAGRTLSYGYDQDGLLETETRPSGQYKSYAYDINYNLILHTLYTSDDTRTWVIGHDYGSPADNTTLSAGKPWKDLVRNQEDSLDLETVYEYEYGNISKITDPSGMTIEYEYDTLNRVILITEQESDTQTVTTSLGYDAQGNLNWVTDSKGQSTTYTYDDAGNLVQQVSPDTGTTTYAYDEAGNMIFLQANDGQQVRYGYDDEGRLAQISFEDGLEDITYSYDQTVNGIGRLTNISDSSGATAYSYDAFGRVTSVDWIVDSLTFSSTFTWDDGRNRPETITYPSGRVVSYTSDADGNIQSVATTYNGTSQTLAENILYAPFGPVTSFDLGNGLSETRDADLQYRANYISVPGVVDLSLTYNNAGYISGMSNTLEALGSFKPVDASDDTTTFGYESGTNRLDTITDSQGSSLLTYDDKGNIVIKGDLAFDYSQNNRLSSVSSEGEVIGDYTYNSFGLRTHKTVDGQTTLYHYDLAGNLICESSADGSIQKEYIYLGSLPLAMVVHETQVQTYFYHTNHLGTPVAMTDDTGEVVWQANYSPFGSVEVTTETVENNLRFPGQYFDGETGLHYNMHRYYDPATGRYLTPDPIGLAGGINPFVYALNNPLNYTDPKGLWVPQLIGGGIGLVVGGVSGYMTSGGDWGATFRSAAVGGGAGVLSTLGIPGAQAVLGNYGATLFSGMVMGSASGFAGNVASQVFVEGKDLECVDYDSAWTSAAAGGLGGALGAAATGITTNQGLRIFGELGEDILSPSIGGFSAGGLDATFHWGN